MVGSLIPIPTARCAWWYETTQSCCIGRFVAQAEELAQELVARAGQRGIPAVSKDLGSYDFTPQVRACTQCPASERAYPS